MYCTVHVNSNDKAICENEVSVKQNKDNKDVPYSLNSLQL
jgi:hypothetical protein